MKSKSPKDIGLLRGQTLTEYLIIVALIGIASIGILRILGHNIQSRIAVISDRIIGRQSEAQGRLSKQSDYRMRDLDDFQKAGE